VRPFSQALLHKVNIHGFSALEQAAKILKITRERVRQIESCGEAKLIRVIARRFPYLLPEGMTPEIAMVLADQKDWGKKAQTRKKEANIRGAQEETKREMDALAMRGNGAVS